MAWDTVSPIRVLGRLHSGGRGNPGGHTTDGPGDVPGAAQPKSRPPVNLRDRMPLFLHSHLSTYTGPYGVGALDIEVPARNPRVFSDIRRNHKHALGLETVLMTVYYPAAQGSGAGRGPSGGRWSRPTWLPRPRFSTAHAYGLFAGIGYLAIPIFATSTFFCKLPAFRNARLAEHWPPIEGFTKSGARVKDQTGPRPPGASEKPELPMLIFSHGLGGSRSMYSSLCGEFASYGFVVVAVEHRDGSCARSFINHTPEGHGSFEEREATGGIDHLPEERKKGYHNVDCLFPLGNERDTAPNNDKGVDKELRDAQIELRCSEIQEAYHVMCDIVAGNGFEKIAQNNLRAKGYRGSSSGGLDGVEWQGWKDRVNLVEVTVAGHSFGAATTVNVLRDDQNFPWAKQGIIYDVWGAGIRIPPPDEKPGHKIKVPILAINSEAFTYWEKNYQFVKALIDEAQASGAPGWLMTVRGTIHINQSDISILYPHICEWALKMTANPARALDLNINASLEFLRLVMSKQLAYLTRSVQTENLLTSPQLDPKAFSEEDLHKPKQQWLAARLNIPNELSYRLSPRQRRQRKAEQKAAKKRIRSGEFLPEEIWMHYTPPDDLLAGYECYGCESPRLECTCQLADMPGPKRQVTQPELHRSP